MPSTIYFRNQICFYMYRHPRGENAAKMDISFSLSAPDAFFYPAVWFHAVYMLQSKHWRSGDTTCICTRIKKGHTATAGVFD